jgi:integrase
VQLKILANMVGIPLKLTTHIARHTFRQLLAEADIYEMGVIKRMMGHSRNGEIDGIYYAVTESRLMEAKRKFELYLEKAFS